MHRSRKDNPYEQSPLLIVYDIVGSFLRTKAIHEARSKFEAGEISAEELIKVEDAEITGLVKKEENVGLHRCYRRRRVSPFLLAHGLLWGLTGTQKVKSEHFSVAFKGFQPKAETVKMDKLDFPDDHPFLKHFAFLQSVAPGPRVQPKQCIPSPSMLNLIWLSVRPTDYQPIERYKDEQVLFLDDLAAAYQKWRRVLRCRLPLFQPR